MGETEIVIEPGHQDIVMTRVFDAPRDAVFRALTDPDLLAQWWGRRSTGPWWSTWTRGPGAPGG